jgi:hypothetical protein
VDYIGRLMTSIAPMMVADLGMQVKGWSSHQAVEYLKEAMPLRPPERAAQSVAAISGNYARVVIERHFKPEVIDAPSRHAAHLDETRSLQSLPELETHFHALGLGLGARDAGFELPNEFVHVSLHPGFSMRSPVSCNV